MSRPRLTSKEARKIKNTTIILAALIALSTHETKAADNELSFGAGIGALYSGIGVNAALRSEHDFKYVAAGCIGLGYSNNSGWILPCGIAAGWLWTNFLSQTNNRHGIGLYAGPVGVKNNLNGEDDIARYGLGISYVYFRNGIDANGWNVGITPALGKEDGKTKGSLLLNAGYQF